MPTIDHLLTEARAQLTPHSDTARIDAELLLAHVLGTPRSYLYAWPERALDAQTVARYKAMLARRQAGEPLAYLIGEREFWSLRLRVTPDTLIPRPDTETLVEAALALVPGDATLAIADLGTGTGAIALALASERPQCHITATDRSAAALDVARDNARRLGLHNVSFRCGSWCQALHPAADTAPGTARAAHATDTYALIVSNPPYVAEADPHLSTGDVRHEPRSALSAGPEGLDDLRQIIACARRHLCRDGYLLVEHGFDQADAVAALLTAHGYHDVRLHHDTGARPRATQARYRPPHTTHTALSD